MKFATCSRFLLTAGGVAGLAVSILSIAATSQVRSPGESPLSRLLSHPLHTPEEDARLGDAYLHGDGVKASFDEAMRWYQAAANAGDPRAQTALALLYVVRHGDAAAAAGWLRRASADGYLPATFYLGRLYYLGVGVTRDDAEAARLMRHAAEKGYAPAEADLGALYYLGQGVERDLDRAQYWLKAAAHKKQAMAEFTLGVMYASADGIPNPAEAVKWYRRSAAHDYPPAKNNLGAAYERGVGVQRDMEQAVRWYRQAAEEGALSAFTNLGRIYSLGNGVAVDIEQGLSWYRAADLCGGLDPALARAVEHDVASRPAEQRDRIEAFAKSFALKHNATFDDVFARRVPLQYASADASHVP